MDFWRHQARCRDIAKEREQLAECFADVGDGFRIQREELIIDRFNETE